MPSSAVTQRVVCEQAYLPGGWAQQVVIGIDAAGFIREVKPGGAREQATAIGRYVIPGMPNLHSHAFQRAMAGLAEHMTDASDSFWTWRETMYRFAGRVEPDTLHAIASQLYVELLQQGYTAVCEFHYLHHRPDGGPYDVLGAMAHAVLAAARDTGIGITLLPTLYQAGGFDGRSLTHRQERFAHDTDGFLRLIDAMRAEEDAQTRVGIALHSLRAVPPNSMAVVLDSALASEGPLHIHIAEQQAEVEDCLRMRGARPVAWLLDHAAVDARWCLVHATHLTDTEIRGLARSGAIAGLCPTTEANLGDGVFPLKPYLEAGGCYGVGSDSHISTSPIEDLRWLEYTQRLVMQKRNVHASVHHASTGENLWRGALDGGARAAGRALGAIAPGHRADLLVLDHDAPELAGCGMPHLFDALVFAGNRSLVRDVMVGGQFVVRDGRHRSAEPIAERYRRAAELLAVS